MEMEGNVSKNNKNDNTLKCNFIIKLHNYKNIYKCHEYNKNNSN